jgi:phenylalanyl-tRNA synthetase alpha chain
MARLKELACVVMEAVGFSDYELETTESEVYGETLDITADGVEIASGSYGPHPLDRNWGVSETWVGIGIGIERLAMLTGGYNSIKRVGRSVAYVDGTRLNV